MPNSSETPDADLDLASFLAKYTPFQAMAVDELDATAADCTVVDLDASALVADYAAHVPDEVWMVRSGQVSLTASDGSVIDTVGPGGLFGYAAAHVGVRGVRGAHHDAHHPDPAARRPGPCPVREARGSGVPRGVGVDGRFGGAADRGTGDRQQAETDLLHGEVLLVAPETSVRDAVVRMTERGVSYALIRSADGELGIFTDRDLRTRVVAQGCPSTCRSRR